MSKTNRFADEAVRQLAFTMGWCPVEGSEYGPEPCVTEDRAIRMEGERVYGGEGEGLTELMSAWALSHSLFQVKFAAKKKVFGLYLQRLVLHIDDGTAVPRKALTKFPLMASARPSQVQR